jgi:transcription elongation factor Elf1
MQTDLTFQCPYCGEENSVAVDISGGSDQFFIQDCEVCCRPVEIRMKLSGNKVLSCEVNTDSGLN